MTRHRHRHHHHTHRHHHHTHRHHHHQRAAQRHSEPVTEANHPPPPPRCHNSKHTAHPPTYTYIHSLTHTHSATPTLTHTHSRSPKDPGTHHNTHQHAATTTQRHKPRRPAPGLKDTTAQLGVTLFNSLLSERSLTVGDKLTRSSLFFVCE